MPAQLPHLERRLKAFSTTPTRRASPGPPRRLRGPGRLQDDAGSRRAGPVARAGKQDQAEIIAQVGEGFLVQSITGVHSGVNRVSGDFSVGAEGLMIRGGELAEPVREVTMPRRFSECCSTWSPSAPTSSGCPALRRG